MYTCTVTCKVSDLVSVGLMNISDKAKMKMKESIVSLGNVKTNKLSFTLVPSSRATLFPCSLLFLTLSQLKRHFIRTNLSSSFKEQI